MARDMLGKAANKVGEVAGQAAATAAQWYRLDSEQRQLAKLRAQALQVRAQIGEEMYKLWQARTLPPSSLDALFRDIDRTMTAIEAQRARVEELRAHFSFGEGVAPPADPVVILDQDSQLQVVEQQLAPPPAPAAPTRRLAAPATIEEALVDEDAPLTCPSCGRPGPAGKAFCGYCGARLR
ncbi:MAG TPA: zinc ribbon domain-containing protein [Chloroflexota bacterium]|jgi:hypothetical protein|nr:zinc ribbon domain-containing protein [Chloroflexota bacterium]